MDKMRLILTCGLAIGGTYAASRILSVSPDVAAVKVEEKKDVGGMLAAALKDPDRLHIGSSDDHQGTCEHSYHQGVPPMFVVKPKTTEEVAAVVAVARECKVPIVGFGSGTSLEGQTAVTSSDQVVVDFSEMDEILEFSPDNLHVKVQPGISYNRLNEFLRPHNLAFFCDPGPGASIGGMLSTSCSGTHAVRHGTVREAVISLTAVMGTGDIISGSSKARKSSAGYRIFDLVVGSEGTVGLITDITLKVKPIPPHQEVWQASFTTVAEACAAVQAFTRAGVDVGRVELMDAAMIGAANKGCGLSLSEMPTLFIELSSTKEGVQAQAKLLKPILEDGGAKVKIPETKEESDKLWQARKEALWISKYAAENPDDTTMMCTDICVPLGSLGRVIEETIADLDGIPGPVVAHAGDGNCHFFLLPTKDDPESLERAHAVHSRMVARAQAVGGTCTGEHGVGVGKIKYLPGELSPGALQVHLIIKDALDPDGVLNPGKVIPSDPEKAWGVSRE